MKNSTKFTHQGFVRVTAKKAWLFYAKNDRLAYYSEAVEFEISDTGIGMA